MSIAMIRKFTLSDAMVLVAAAAGAMTLARFGLSLPSHRSATAPQYWIAPVRIRVDEISAFLLSWTLALLALRPARPRQRWSRLARQPGLAACYSTTVGFAFGLLHFVCFIGDVARSFKATGSRLDAWLYHSLLGGCSGMIATCIAMAWLTLRMSGRWQRDADWIGRAGSVLGWSWIALHLAMIVPVF